MHSGGSETILLVDDEALVRSVAAMTLKAAGYRVIEAASPEDAMVVSETHDGPIHLLLSDVSMPTMNGAKLARIIRQSRPGLRVVLSSGYGEESTSGADDVLFLAKPYTPDELLAHIRTALAKAS
ncbi:MAG: hypothetical protein AMXMBFR58_02620 [Phycisphaerae bacterium]